MMPSFNYQADASASREASLRFVAFLETAADGDAYAALLPPAGLGPRQVMFFAMTHEARRWLVERDWANEWVWNQVDETAIKSLAWREADRMTDAWEGENCWPDPFVRRCVSPEFWRLYYHAFASEQLLMRLRVAICDKTLLMLPVEGRPLGSFRLELVVSNDVFRAVVQGFARHHRLQSRMLRSSLWLRVRNNTRAVRYVLRHILDDFRDSWRQGPELEELACSHPYPSGVAHSDVLIVNWRGDMERTFRMPDLLPHLEAAGLSGTHLVWAPNPANLPEKAPQGQSVFHAGLRIPSIPVYLRDIMLPAGRVYVSLRRRMQTFLLASGYPAVARAPLAFEYLHLAFHATRETVMARRVIRTALRIFSPRVLVGSDVNICMFRAFLLEARSQKTLTVSVNHAYYMWDTFSRYNWLADVQCVNGPAVEGHLMEEGESPMSIVVTGNAVLADVPFCIAKDPEGRPRIVIVTTSFFGLWSSLSSIEADDGSGVERLACRLSEHLDWDVVIKSHPVADFHKLYDDIVARAARSNMKHVRAYWSNEDFAACAVAVVCGGMTSAILQLQRAGVPIIYLADQMTDTLWRERHFDYAGCGCAVSSPDQAQEAVLKVTTDAVFRAEVQERGHRFLERYRGDPAGAMPVFSALLARLAKKESAGDNS